MVSGNRVMKQKSKLIKFARCDRIISAGCDANLINAQKSFVTNNKGRETDDFYRTPAPCTLALCDELKRRGIEPTVILDVGCGDGAIGKVLGLSFPNAYIVGIEQDTRRFGLAEQGEIYAWMWLGDWVDSICADVTPPNLIVSNPSFKHALRFIELALARVRPSGHVAFLLPSQWHQETNQDADGRPRERGRFLDKLRKPNGDEGYGVLEYEGRVDFRGNGNTDRITYTWYVFGPGFEGVHCRIPRYAPDPTERLSMGIV